jgi:hypothetical protein
MGMAAGLILYICIQHYKDKREYNYCSTFNRLTRINSLKRIDRLIGW